VPYLRRRAVPVPNPIWAERERTLSLKHIPRRSQQPYAGGYTMSYITDDPTDGAQPVAVYIRGGGQETYTGYDPTTATYAPHRDSRAVIARVSSSPIRYERRLGDGSVEVYAQPDGALSFPRRVFLTQSIDPQGQALSLTHDASLRLVAVTDAIGQVTTLSYELPGDPLKVTGVTDPFGRLARLEYDGSGRLVRITDVIGMVSEFEYGEGDFITAMTTPYGRTTFAAFDEGRRRWVEATDPLGGRSGSSTSIPHDAVTGEEATPSPTHCRPATTRPDSVRAAANLSYRNTFFWDKQAMALHPGDYSKARMIHWLHTPGLTQTAGVIENEKAPLETMRTYYTYPDQGWQATGRMPPRRGSGA
jgi:YD repeat-containing protein